MKKRSRKKIWTAAAALALVVAVLPIVGLGGSAAEHAHNCGNDSCTLDGVGSWTELTQAGLSSLWDGVSAYTLAADTSYYLAENVELSSTLHVSGTNDLCLNGKTLSLKAGGSGSVIAIDGGATLNLCDCGEGGIITGGNAENGGGVYVNTNGTFNMYGGVITDNDATNGGGVYVYVDGAFNMTGGVIGDADLEDGIDKGNTATESGGGVYSMINGGNSVFYVSGSAKISGNTANEGGGVYAFIQYGGLTLTVSGNAEISGNTALSDDGGGGGMHLGCADQGSSLIMSGNAKIIGNRTTGTGGGGIYTEGLDIAISDNAKISNNEAETGAGGGIYAYNGYNCVVTMTGGEISGNEAATDGGGIYSQWSTVNLSGGSIADNIATEDGGGVYNNGTLTLPENNTAKISDNEAANGGGVYNSGTVTMTGGTISGNKVVGDETNTGYGGGVYVSDAASFDMTGGFVSGNTVVHAEESSGSGSGGGVYVKGGTFRMEAGPNGSFGTISGNTTDQHDGAGVSLSTDSSFEMSTGVIKNNRAGIDAGYANFGSGGGVHIGSSAAFTMTGGVIGDPDLTDENDEGNTAANGGGGVKIDGGTFTMSGGFISGNEAWYGGGGVSLSSSGTFTMEEGPNGSSGTINGNKILYEYGSGGGISITQNDFTMEAGTIGGTDETDANTAPSGGGVEINGISYADYTITMTGGEIIGNKAYRAVGNEWGSGKGGGVWLDNNITLKMSNDARIADNAAENWGGGVYFGYNCTLDISGDISLTGGEAEIHGGDVAFENGSNIRISGELTGTYEEPIYVGCGSTCLFAADVAANGVDPAYGWNHHMQGKTLETYFDTDNADQKIVNDADNSLYNGEGLVLLAKREIYFEANGGSFGTDENGSPITSLTKKYFVGDTITKLTPEEEPYLEGKVVAAWNTDYYLDPAYNWDFENGVVGDYDPTNLFAVWTDSSYTVKFDGNADDVEGTMPTQEFRSSETQQLRANQFERDGWSFLGWDKDGDGQMDYADGADFTAPTEEGETTLYAVWEADTVTYTVTFEPGEAEGEPYTQTFTEGVEQALESNRFSYDGYTFAGWLTDDEDALYQDEEPIIVYSDLTLTAQWEEEPSGYMVEFYVGGELYDAYSEETDYYIEIGEYLFKPADPDDEDGRLGYAWYRTPALEENGRWNFDEDTVKESDLENGVLKLYGKLVKIHTVRYWRVIPGPDFDPENALAAYWAMGVKDGDYADATFRTSPDPDTGIKVGAWYANVEFAGEPFDFSTPIHADTDLYPYWVYADGTPVDPPKDPTPPTPPSSGGGGGGGGAPLKDTDGDGIPDILDDDDDNDGLLDFEDPNPLVPDNIVDLGCPCERFDDVEHNAWYEEYVGYVVENGIMEGISSSLFDPNGTASRAEIVMTLWRIEGAPLVSHPLYFSDVNSGAWYVDALRWTNSENIVLGYDDGRFGTDDPVTREQIATILWRYARFKGVDTSSGENTSLLKFSDAKKISAYAISALQWACGEEIIEGTVDKTGAILLDPQGSATRAQIAAILMRFCENIL